MASTYTTIWQPAAPLSLVLKPNNSVPPCMSLEPAWELTVSLSASKSGVGPFKRNVSDYIVFHLTQPQLLVVSKSEMVGTCLPTAGTQSWRAQYRARTPHLSVGEGGSADNPPYSRLPHVVVGLGCFIFLPLLPF